ncbi:hypothetical protein AVEN_261772-1, partial [Araneus ventricosus]
MNFVSDYHHRSFILSTIVFIVLRFDIRDTFTIRRIIKSRKCKRAAYLRRIRYTAASARTRSNRFKKRNDSPSFQNSPFLHQRYDPNTLQITHRNVRSPSARYEDIAADPCTTNGDILPFVETRTHYEDKFDRYHLFS